MINDFEESDYIVIKNYGFHVGQLRGGQWQRRGRCLKVLPLLVARCSEMRTTTVDNGNSRCGVSRIGRLSGGPPSFARSEKRPLFSVWVTPHNISMFEPFLYSDQQRG
jgi:hypothetical protein